MRPWKHQWKHPSTGGPWAKQIRLALEQGQVVSVKQSYSLADGQVMDGGFTKGMIQGRGCTAFLVVGDDVALTGLTFDCRSMTVPAVIVTGSRARIFNCVFLVEGLDSDAVLVSGGDNGMFNGNMFVGTSTSGYSFNIDGGTSNAWSIAGNVFEGYRYNTAGNHADAGNIPVSGPTVY